MINVMSFTVLAIFVVIIVIFVIQKFSSNQKLNLTYKTKYKVLFSYIVVLLFATVIYLSFVQPKMAAIKIEEVHAPILYDIVYGEDGQVGELPEQFIKDEWEMEPINNEIEIALTSGMYDAYFSIPVVVEERNDQNQNVKAILYETPTTFLDRDISEQVSLAKLSMEGNQLNFYGEEEYIPVYFRAVDKDMTVKQFLASHPYDRGNYFSFDHGEQVLYLSVPKKIKIKADEDFFDIIKK